ncbi:hypothetical protein [Zhouia amylolytica]|uniref:UspA domain-containing protein n=1 Tax=Zhouia amylolytica AD3 TaxID=1286632 RepID=W2UUD6_9FLAO|nr:hypothetical protein [Zhouia amylolytica]ETN96962.1 hypothetical protein P278_03880 [Zhouia amylolytica AD3]
MKNILIPITDKKITITDLKKTVDPYRSEALNVVLLYISKCKDRPTELMISALRDTFEDDALAVLMPLKRELLKEYNYLSDFSVITESSYKSKYDSIVEAIDTYQVDVVALTQDKSTAGLKKLLGLNDKDRIESKLSANPHVVLV